MSCDQDVVDQVISASQGDLRKAITLLQSASHLKGSEMVTGQDILEIAGVRQVQHCRDIVLVNTSGGATLIGGVSVCCVLYQLV